MKRIYLPIVVFLFFGMTVFAQSPDMSFYTEEYNRSGATVFELLDILQVVRDEKLTGIGDFYHNAIRVYIHQLPNFTGSTERVAVEEAARIILRGLAAEKHTAAAPEIWYLVQYFDIASQQNDGYIMYEALVAIGQVGAKDYTPHLVSLLDGFNARATTNAELKAQIQRVVPGIINSLEVLREPNGVKPILIASAGWFDTDVKAIATAALLDLMEALGEVIGDIVNTIMRDPFNSSNIKYTAWKELLESRAPDSAKSKVAAAALEASYSSIGLTAEAQNLLRFMRFSAIDTIRLMGVEDDSVYPYLERTYREAFETSNRDFESIIKVIEALSAVKTDEAVDLLTLFLRGINTRRHSGPWGNSERDIMRVLIQAITNTGTQSTPAIQLLRVIQNSSNYTGAEQGWARTALTQLGM